ncbi:hypothetical protein N665_1866s0001 [Sinapis alba]|nr:hypothetical protein N665_1866s0001 [Sinapis alba]
MLVSKECSVVLQNKPIKKLGDRGKFVVSIQIGRTVFQCSMYDLGSNVNLMPYYVAKRLGLTNFKPTRISLVFADISVRMPVVILEDLHVQVGNTMVPADFVVLELDDEPKDPLILGRPFMCTVGAIIDVRNGRIDLQLEDIIMKFEMNKLLKRPMLDGQTFTVYEHDTFEPQEGIIEEILAGDPLEITLVIDESEHNVLNVDADGYAKMLDSSKCMEKMVAYLSLYDSKEGNQGTLTGAAALIKTTAPPHQIDDHGAS